VDRPKEIPKEIALQLDISGFNVVTHCELLSQTARDDEHSRRGKAIRAGLDLGAAQGGSGRLCDADHSSVSRTSD